MAELNHEAGQKAQETDEKEKKTQAQILVELAKGAKLFHDTDDTSYATIESNGHKETWPIRSTRFSKWLQKQYYYDHYKPPGGQAQSDAVDLLDAKASIDGERENVFIRVGHLSNAIYVDLVNENWEVVEITPNGWKVLPYSDSPVNFKRSKGMASLPLPEGGGDIQDLKHFINYPDDNGLKLMIAWLVAAYAPEMAYPVLTLQGEQGSGKSGTAKVLRALVDPSPAPLRTTPREERDLMVGAQNAHVLSYDNLSGMSNWLSDSFCRLSTGGAIATRQLYSDGDEVIFEAKRPILLNGIDDIATRPDLLDRALVMVLPSIDEADRKDERELQDSFDKAKPKLLGALFDALSGALYELPNTFIEEKPRMADFALWVTAAEKSLGWEEGSFMDAYIGNRAEAIELGIESDPVGGAILQLMNEQNEWEGLASQLVGELGRFVDDKTRNSKAWPTSRKIKNRLRRLAPPLRKMGIEHDSKRAGQGVMITIRQTSLTSTLPTSSTQIPTRQGFSHVDNHVDNRKNVDNSLGYVDNGFANVDNNPTSTWEKSHNGGENVDHVDHVDNNKPPLKDKDVWI